MKIGVNFLNYRYKNILSKEKSIYEQIFKTRYKLKQHKDQTFYIVTILPKDSPDMNVAVDKKTGGILHFWSGE